MLDVVVLEAGWTIPETTPAQYALSVALVVFFALAVLVLRARYKQWGLTDRQKRIREQARAQKRDQSPRMLQLPSTAIRDGVDDLHKQVDGLLDRDLHPEETRTPMHSAVGQVYRAVSVAWTSRLEAIPRLARRAFGLGVTVAVLGAVAVSTSAVVAFLTHDPSAPAPSAVITELSTAARTAIDIVGLFPFAGKLWQVAFATSILLAQWLYEQWALITVALFASAVGITVLNWYLDPEDVPDRVVQRPRQFVALVAGVMMVVWSVGAGVAFVGRAVPGGRLIPAVCAGLLGIAGLYAIYVGVRSVTVLIGWVGVVSAFAVAAALGSAWPSILGVLLAGEIALYFACKLGPRAVHNVAATIRSVAGSDAVPAAVYMVVQRGALAGSSLAAGLVVVYALAGVSEGKFRRVFEAALNASPEIQAALGAGIVGGVALLAYLVSDSWPDVKAALHAAFSQKAVRVQLIGRGLPFLVVGGSYVLLYEITQRILVSVGLSIIVGLVVRVVIQAAIQAAYRADGQAILKRIVHPDPMYVAWLAYVLEIDGQTYFLVDVNGNLILSDDRREAVNAAVAIGEAKAMNEQVPSLDADWYADFLLEHGIADRDEWDAKLDEKIREEIFSYLRDKGPQVTRDRFDNTLDDFADERVSRRLHAKDIRPFLTLGSQYVSLSSDPHASRQQRSWPSFSD